MDPWGLEGRRVVFFFFVFFGEFLDLWFRVLFFKDLFLFVIIIIIIFLKVVFALE